MAFPTIPTSAAGRIVSALSTAGGATNTFPDLSTLTKNSGDLLIAIIVIYDGNSTNAEFSSWGGGFTEFVDQATTATMGIGAAYKWSDGTETGTFTVTSADASATDRAMIIISIPGAHPSTPPEGGVIANGTAVAAAIEALNPTGWDAEDTLWIAVGGAGETGTGGAFTGMGSAPTDYGDYFETAISADAVGGVQAALAFRQLNAASEDPDNFAVDTSNARNSALLIAVRPAPPPPELNAEAASETDTPTDAVLQVEPVLVAEIASETDTPADATLAVEQALAAEVVSETDTAFDAVLAVELAIIAEGPGAGDTLDESPGVEADDGYCQNASSGFINTNPQIGHDVTFATNLPFHGWWRFPNVAIPQGVEITTAYITLTNIGSQSGGSVLSKIYGIAEDDHVAPTTAAEWGTDHGIHTTAAVDWDFTTATSGTRQSPSIASIIQEIVDRGGWASGQDIGLHIDNDGTAAGIWQQVAGVSGTEAVLHIEYGGGTSETDVAFDAVLEVETPALGINAEAASETDTPSDAVLTVEPVLAAEVASETDTPVDAALTVEPVLAAEVASETDTPSDAALTVEPVLAGEVASETDTSFDATLTTALVLVAESASETDTTFDAVLEVEPGVVIERRLARYLASRRLASVKRRSTPSYPTAATTGLAGVGLTVEDLTPHSGNFTTSSNGQIVELLDISGSLIISHDNVLVRKCRIIDSGYWVVDARNGNPGFVIEDCLIDAQGDNGGEGYIAVAGRANVYRCDISNAENAIVIEASGAIIQGNYLHHFRAGSATPHYDGIENNGGASNIDILGNTIDLDQSDTSTVNINNDWGPIDDVRIEGNRLLGGGYTLTIDDQFSGTDEITNVQIVDNRLGEGALGYALVRSAGMISEESGNIDDVTEEPVSL